MAELCKNLVSCTLASSLGATDTTIALKAGDGAQLPSITSGTANTFRIAVTDKTGATEIIMICRRESGSDTLYVGTGTGHQAAGNIAGRAQESTSALAVTYTDDHIIEMPPTGAQMQAALEYSSISGMTPSVAEINLTCYGNTATAAEIKELHSAGAVNADFVKLHALTESAALIDAAADLLDPANCAIGDLFTEVSAGTMGRIAAVAATQYLKSAGVATSPAYGKLALSDTGVKIGSVTLTTTGDTVITGVGFSPSVVIFGSSCAIAGRDCSFCLGFDDGTSHYCGGIIYEEGVVTATTSATKSIFGHTSIGIRYSYISAKSSDGFTLTTTDSSSGYITYVTYLALP